MKKVSVLVTQIQEGFEYHGFINFNRSKFNYKLIIGVHLDILTKQVDPIDLDEKKTYHRNLFNFSLNNQKNEIKIEDELFGFLVGIITPNVFDYHQSKVVRNLHMKILKLVGGGIESTKLKKLVGFKYTFDLPNKQIPKVLLAS